MALVKRGFWWLSDSHSWKHQDWVWMFNVRKWIINEVDQRMRTDLLVKIDFSLFENHNDNGEIWQAERCQGSSHWPLRGKRAFEVVFNPPIRLNTLLPPLVRAAMRLRLNGTGRSTLHPYRDSRTRSMRKSVSIRTTCIHHEGMCHFWVDLNLWSVRMVKVKANSYQYISTQSIHTMETML